MSGTVNDVDDAHDRCDDLEVIDGDDGDGVVVEADGQLGGVRMPGQAPDGGRLPVPGGGELLHHVQCRELEVREDAGVEGGAEGVE